MSDKPSEAVKELVYKIRKCYIGGGCDGQYESTHLEAAMLAQQFFDEHLAEANKRFNDTMLNCMEPMPNKVQFILTTSDWGRLNRAILNKFGADSIEAPHV